METAGATPNVAVTLPELTEVLRSEGPFLTLHVTTEAEIPNAAQRSEQHWRALRTELEGAGVDRSLLDAVDALVPDAHLRGDGLFLIGTPAGVAHVEHTEEPPPRDLWRWEALPFLLPLLHARQRSVPHVVALVDRQGADLTAVRREGPDLRLEAGGDGFPLRKPAGGGWSQKRYQQRGENTWEDNAEDVAKELTRLVEHVGGRVVVLAGDVRGVQLLRDSLPAEVAELVEVVGGGRSVDGSEDDVGEAARRVVTAVVERDTRALLEKFEEERGQGDRAADGPARTVDALAAAQVEVLLVHHDREDEREAWFGPEPSQLALTADAVRAFGVDEPKRARLVDVAVRAAVGTGAGVRLVGGDHGPRDGLGAVLRWASGAR